MKRIIAASVIFLAGAVVYMLFRPRVLLGFLLLDSIGVGEWVDSLRFSASGIQLPAFVVYSLPNGLWSLSYLLVIDTITDVLPLHKRAIWASVIPVIGIVSEFLQLPGWVPGVFDTQDLLCYSIPLIVYLSWLHLSQKRN